MVQEDLHLDQGNSECKSLPVHSVLRATNQKGLDSFSRFLRLESNPSLRCLPSPRRPISSSPNKGAFPKNPLLYSNSSYFVVVVVELSLQGSFTAFSTRLTWVLNSFRNVLPAVLGLQLKLILKKFLLTSCSICSLPSSCSCEDICPE